MNDISFAVVTVFTEHACDSGCKFLFSRGSQLNRPIRPIIDMLMLGLLLTLRSHTYLSGALHEAVGVTLLAVVGLHVRFSIRKARGLLNVTVPWFRLACRSVEILLAVNLLLLAISGISLARDLFALTAPPLRPSLARPLHRVLAHTGFLLTGVHLGLRLPGFLAFTGFRREKTPSGRFSRVVVYLACGLTAVYGSVAAVRREYFRIDLTSNLMMFSNPEEPLAAFLLDHAAIFVLAIAAGVLARRFLRAVETRKRSEG